MNPERYVNERLVGWMKANVPEVLGVIRSNDMGATTVAILGWMAKNKPSELRDIEFHESELGERGLTAQERRCSEAMIDAVEAAIGPLINLAALEWSRSYSAAVPEPSNRPKRYKVQTLMIKTIGFYGGASICELGPAADVQLFFDCVGAFVAPGLSKHQKILIDRLYRRYVRHEDVLATQELMDEISEAFAKVPTSSIDLSGLAKPSAKTRLDPSKPTLSDLFSQYFLRYLWCRESADGLYKDSGLYRPIRLAVTDMPEFITDNQRPLEEYDALEGASLWSKYV